MLTKPERPASIRSTILGLLAGLLLLLALDAVLITVPRLLDPGAPLLMISNLVGTFIGALQLPFAVPLALWQRRRRPALAAGLALGMVLVIVLNAVALYN
jgi:hypothetical protein